MGWILLGSSLFVPWVAANWARRRLQLRGQVAPLLTNTALYLGAAVVCLGGLLFTTCGYPGAPGEGAVPSIGKRRATQVMIAVASYRASEGAYPDSLAQLVPRWLPDTVEPGFVRMIGHRLEYRKQVDSSSYTLSFDYTGPGSNMCEWSSNTNQWHCSGAF